MKPGSFKGSPRKKVYRLYKYFDIDLFNIVLQEKINTLGKCAHSAFSSAFRVLLNEHAPLKILRYNSKTFITKKLRKEIMKSEKSI